MQLLMVNLCWVIVLCVVTWLPSSPQQAVSFREHCIAFGAANPTRPTMYYRNSCYVYHGENADRVIYDVAKSSCNDMPQVTNGHLAFVGHDSPFLVKLREFDTCREIWTGLEKVPRTIANNYNYWYWTHPDGRQWYTPNDTKTLDHIKWIGVEPAGATVEGCGGLYLGCGGLDGMLDYCCACVSFRFLCQYRDPYEQRFVEFQRDLKIDDRFTYERHWQVDHLLKCIRFCAKSPPCQSVSYWASLQLCELHDIDDAHYLFNTWITSATGVISYRHGD